MKAIIPVAGTGAKLRPHTYTQPKALLPLAGKTVLGFIIDKLKSGNIQEFIFIIGYLGEKIQQFVTENYPDLKCHFVVQNELLGIGHAIKLTREIVQNDEIFVVLGDSFCEFDIDQVLHEPGNLLAIKKVEDPRNFGVAHLSMNNVIDEMIEKPSIPRSNNAIVGLYKIKDTELLFDCMNEYYNKISHINQNYHLTDALQCMINKGASFKSFQVKKWFDCGKISTLLEANAILLQQNKSKILTPPDHVINSVILNPVYIAPNCDIQNCIIGPHVSIGNNVKLTNCIITNSIIGSFSHLKDIVLTNSIIGSDAIIKGMNRTLNIGDNTEIDFG
ncbi:MAG: sugar phosphate nucleotidyltransferase [Alphaproteobacteria bacterium]|nr:sugar phosphate nucleotidyltransferase [Alphaproteobacteria bacterium]